MQWYITRTWSVDSLGQYFLDLLDQVSWCQVGMARSLGLHRCGMGCHMHWCQGILLNSWCGRNSWSLFHLGCQCCRCSRCGLHAQCRCRWCRLFHYEAGSWQSLWCGSGAIWDSVDCFDTVFMEMLPCTAVCGTIAGTYLIAVLWEDAYHSSRHPNLSGGVVHCNWLTSIQWHKCFAVFISLCLSRFRVCINLLIDLWGWWVTVAYLGWNGCSWFIMKTLPGWFEHNSLLNAKQNWSTCLPFDTQMTCAKEMWELIYMYHKNARLVYWSTATAALGAVLKTKQYDHTTSPFLRLWYGNFIHDLLGMWMVVHCNQSPWTVWVNSS